MIKLKIEIIGIELAAKVKEGMKPDLPWYYGFSYRSPNKFALVFHIIPLNYLAKFWYRLNQFKYELLFLVLSVKPVRDFVIKRMEAKK